MSDMNIFEYAAKNKMRFTYKGVISVEDLYDLKVEELDSIYKNLVSVVKERNEESLLDTKTSKDKDIDVAIEIIKKIVKDKLEAAENKKKAAEKRAQKQKILAVMADKQDAELKEKSIEELQKMLDDME